jgi:hypothetical protein
MQVRKRAQSSAGEVLAALQASPANLAAASEAIVASECSERKGATAPNGSRFRLVGQLHSSTGSSKPGYCSKAVSSEQGARNLLCKSSAAEAAG